MAASRKKGVTLRGIGVSPGVVIGPVFLVTSKNIKVVERKISKDEVSTEIARFEDALIETRTQLRDIQSDLEKRDLLSDVGFLDAHLMVLDDRSFIEEVLTGIQDHRRNVEVLVEDVINRYVEALASVEDDYLRERVADMMDVSRRIIGNLSGDDMASLSDLEGKHVLVGVDFVPSETASLKGETVSAFATDLGSPTSHTALMARALEIPAIVGLHDITSQVTAGDEILLDGNKGILIIRPTKDQLKQYGKVAKVRKSIEKELTTLKHEPAETKDKHSVTLSANIESLDELDSVLEYGAQGVGLFRSEYLVMSKGEALDEDEQASIFSDVAARLAPAPVIIRTLDLGGDKVVGCDKAIVSEANPFLGCRSIRLCLSNPEEFKIQLRAILRASIHGDVKIMYPMISSVTEVIQANKLLDEAKAELRSLKIDFNNEIDVGIMIEVPSAALTVEVIADHVQFFSIGTNDLVQYTIAVDRVNERVAYLYQPTHPAVIRLIRETVSVAHKKGAWVGLCGEMAADPLMTPLLVGMGLDELSVPPSAVPLVKDVIRNLQFSEAEELVKSALECKEAAEIEQLCRELTKRVAPELLELI